MPGKFRLFDQIQDEEARIDFNLRFDVYEYRDLFIAMKRNLTGLKYPL